MIVLVVLAALTVGGCGESNDIDSTPEKLNGQPSHEFDSEDIEAAENASEAVQAYCAGIESEAQRVGCLSHVDEGDIP